MPVVTNTSVSADALRDDVVVRLRGWASDQCFLLAGEAEQVVLGAAEDCTIQLTDASNTLSRRHVSLLRKDGRWIASDLESKNGMWIDGSRQHEARLEPGCELGLGGLRLIAESPRLIALRGYLARLLGWASERCEVVDLALRSIRLSSTRHAALALCGDSDGDLLSIARGLHGYVHGDDAAFVLCDPRRRAVDGASYPSGVAAFAAAAGAGSVCVWVKRLPRDFAELTAAIRTPGSHVQLIACGPRPSDRTELVSAPIEIPPLATRAGELDRIIEEYARDASFAFKVDAPLARLDRDWVRTHSAGSLAEIEKGAQRIVALRAAGSVAGAASMLDMAHASLGEWIGRRRLPSGTIR
jgi:hypothetical protein